MDERNIRNDVDSHGTLTLSLPEVIDHIQKRNMIYGYMGHFSTLMI